MIATVVVDQLVEATDAYTYLNRLGYIMIAMTCIPYCSAIVCFYFAGKHYTDYKKCQQYCREATLKDINIAEYLDMKVVGRTKSMVKVRKSHMTFSVSKQKRSEQLELFVDGVSLPVAESLQNSNSALLLEDE